MGKTTKYYNKLSFTVERKIIKNDFVSASNFILLQRRPPSAPWPTGGWRRKVAYLHTIKIYIIQWYITVSSIIHPCLYILYSIRTYQPRNTCGSRTSLCQDFSVCGTLISVVFRNGMHSRNVCIYTTLYMFVIIIKIIIICTQYTYTGRPNCFNSSSSR